MVWYNDSVAAVLSQYQTAEEDTTLKALQTMQVQEEDYFCHVTHRTWDAMRNCRSRSAQL